MVKQVEIKH